MYIDKKNYWLALPLIDKFLKKIILKNRIKIYRIFEKNIEFSEKTKIIDVGTTPILDEHENIIFHGTVSKERALLAMSESDVLINIGNNTSYQLPSKIIEYIGASKPIINIISLHNDTSKIYLKDF